MDCLARRLVVASVSAAALSLCTAPASAQVPPGFVDQPVVPNDWAQAVGIRFAPLGGVASGRMFVWEKAGRVWNVENGVKAEAPLIDLSEEVGDWRDYGLLGFCVDPDFSTNGYIYLFYVVDFYYLTHFGLPDYDPSANDYNRDTMARMVRYTCNAGDGFHSVDYNSRVVLVGESIGLGPPITHQSHGPGTMFFGADGTLIASMGDGASYDGPDPGGFRIGSSNTALADGIITAHDDVGAYRAQMIDSLSGKILRLDPATGDGVPSNPFYDAAHPHSARSRVWALGLRNPFRMAMKPGTGSANPADANPGTIMVGTVGWGSFEGLYVCSAPGLNLGWPIFEGMDEQGSYFENQAFNPDEPNPLVGVNGCATPLFSFHDLIIQDTLASNPLFPNPCDPTQQISDPNHRWIHHRPVLEWAHSGGARVSRYVGSDSVLYSLGDVSCPVEGEPFRGFASIGGAWYTGTEYPEEFRNTYFHADFAAGWMKSLVFDSSDQLVKVQEFMPAGSSATVCVAADPVSGDLHYINYDQEGNSVVRRIRYLGGNNAPPTAVASGAPAYGPVPLTVQFVGSASVDPENEPLTYHWDFGDSTAPSADADPAHVYYNEDDITALGTFIARVDTLDPPGPKGGGNKDPEILRDGVYPPSIATDSRLQYDSYHYGDQGTDDWIGYTFEAPHLVTGILFQEGLQFANGGWFDTLGVEARVEGVYVGVPFTVTPMYAGANGVPLEVYRIDLATPTLTDSVRLRGDPGGDGNFISVAEFRVYGAPASPGPRCRTATLTVKDSVGFTSSAIVKTSLDNTPPSVAITEPVDGSFYPSYRSLDIPLTASVSDAESPTGDLECAWRVILHHNTHTHPEPPDTNCSTTTHLDPHGAPGDMFYYEIRLTVTDPGCLSTTRTAYLYPNPCLPDFNNDGFVTGDDFDQYLAMFEAGC